MTEPERPPMRRDAVANRERILDTAEDYFARHGLGAPLQGLAAAAKVGAGTLYRNFSSQDKVIRALYDRFSAVFDDMTRRASEEPSGWDGIVLVLEEGMELLISKGIVSEVMRWQAVHDPDYRPSERWVGPLGTLVDRAIAEGSARDDLVVPDIGAALILLGSVQTFAPQHQVWISARMKGLVLDGIRAHPHDPSPLTPVPTDFDVDTASIVKREP